MNFLEHIKAYRSKLHNLFPQRSDAVMNLLDSISSYAHRCDSVVKLSEAKCFTRTYCSITDAINASAQLKEARWEQIFKLAYESMEPSSQGNRFILDATGNPRPYAKTLLDKVIIHSPNPAPSNKPICVGHAYSVIVGMPSQEKSKHWVKPLSVKRITSEDKGNEMGMKQLVALIDKLGQSGKLNISFGDCLYSSNQCRATASEDQNLIHIFRLRISRNLYLPPMPSDSVQGRKLEYGQKVKLSDASILPPCDEQTSLSWVGAKGKKQTAHIRGWHNMLIRGTRSFRSSEHPITAIQIEVTDEDGNQAFKRPLWLAVLGKRRDEIKIADVYEGYCSRYDIEHFFRFSKNKMLLDGYQTPDVEHEAAWWKLCMLAYTQLYQARTLIDSIPNPWERFLPCYKNYAIGETATPAQTQRGFEKLLDEIGTPASPGMPRGNPVGRSLRSIFAKRPISPIIFKGSKKKIDAKPVVSNSKKSTVTSEAKRIKVLTNNVSQTLKLLNLSPYEFLEMLIST